MKTGSLGMGLVAAGVLFAGAGRLDGADVAAPQPAPAKAAPAKPAKGGLEKGMPAEEIIKLIGKPAEIKPMPVPEGGTGKAEMWIYRRDGGTRSIQAPIGTRDVPGFVGMGQEAAAQHRKEIIYGPKTIKITQVTSLLMFNDRLVLARQSQEVDERY